MLRLASSRAHTLAAAARRAKHTLPDLAYDYGALEPVISARVMELHHSKHHQTYVNNLNVAQEKLHEAVETGDVSTAIALQPAIKFNGGGHLNHTIFWTNLAPQSQGGGEPPSGELLQHIEATFGSFDNFKAKMNATTVAVQGSGWGWLGYDKASGSLRLATCANQDPLEATTGLVPLLGIDVWEHAYYLDRANDRAKYLECIWDVVNWQNVTERFQAAQN